jgi:hypothetical protein
MTSCPASIWRRTSSSMMAACKDDQPTDNQASAFSCQYELQIEEEQRPKKRNWRLLPEKEHWRYSQYEKAIGSGELDVTS